MRSGGDAGTAIHTPVPFGIVGIMASISPAAKTSAPTPTTRGAGLIARRHSGDVSGMKHANSLRESSF